MIIVDILKNYTLLFKKNYSLLFFAHSISLLGDKLTYIALPIYVYNKTGSAQLLGLTFAIENIPWIIIGPIANIYLERFNKKNLLIICDFMRFIICIGLFFWWNIYYILIASFLLGTFSSIFLPIRTAFIPQIINEDILAYATGFLNLSSNAISIIGPSIAAILLELFPTEELFLFDSITYIISMFMIILIKYKEQLSEFINNRIVLHKEIQNILTTIKDNFELKITIFSESINCFIEGLVQPILLLLITKEFILSNSDYGYVMSFLAGGAILGAILSSNLKPKKNGLSYLRSSCIVMIFTFFAVTINFNYKWIIFGVWFIHGVGKGIFENASTVIMTVFCPEKERSKIFSFTNSIISISILIGNLSSGYITEKIGIKSIFYTGMISMIMLFFVIIMNNLGYTVKKHIFSKKKISR